jgi:hypothetical protein
MYVAGRAHSMNIKLTDKTEIHNGGTWRGIPLTRRRSASVNFPKRIFATSKLREPTLRIANPATTMGAADI